VGRWGAGNHFVEVSVVRDIFDSVTAQKWGMFQNQVVVMIHTGSRGLGHQVATDYIRRFQKHSDKWRIQLPDKQLAAVPFRSKEGQAYFGAMNAAANFAWASRQMITFEVRKAWGKVLGQDSSEKLRVLYDVAHNIAKREEGLLVHRKGATRAFEGQPVIIPGSMGTASYVLLGQQASREQSFGSSCHGAGRSMSRHQAKKLVNSYELKERLNKQGILIEAGDVAALAEEAPEAYKDVDEVVDIVDTAGLAKKVARLRPLAVMKG